ncbi:NAD(P)/FAD-dependent oxidoreductase [Pseudaestuariivita atlantica]|uniref:NAD(P)/FAD-dependent oxidoreductase n=1 Tax=Pseudaestuariivita atlantica TaxID=1317121 RepID=UPI0013F42D81|nr:FAD-dependent oxidoreductase [Pseudaestuariivita atlantica]
MVQHIVVVGAGVIGSAIALKAQERGARVTLVDAGAARASDASFGWINASFYLSEDHFRLRSEGLEAYRRLSRDLDLPLTRAGCLSWEFAGEELARVHGELTGLGYPVERVDAARMADLEPALQGAPEEGLLFQTEAVAEPAALVRALGAAALARGARAIRGVAVTGLVMSGDRVSGVDTTAGRIEADMVVVAAGTASEAVLRSAGIALPMLPRPAYILETPPRPRMLNRVLATTGGEVRQRADGVIVMPTSAAHQRDDAAALEDAPGEAADAALARLQEVLPQAGRDWAQVRLAHRPMPADGLPVIGAAAPGVYAATMHSGLTLAAITGELAAQEICEGPSNTSTAMLAQFRPQRFA